MSIQTNRVQGPKDIWEREAAARLPALLEAWLEEPVVEIVANTVRGGVEIDLVVRTANRALVVEVKGSDNIAALDRGLAHLLRIQIAPGELRLLVVPYMGPGARAWARSREVSWADLSGNADIRAQNLRVFVDGKSDQFAHAGRPANPFAPRYARVSRVLLDAWVQRYSAADHHVHRFQAVARTGYAALQGLGEKLATTRITWAATGLAAAYMYTQFADFRLNTLFVDELPRDPEALGLHRVDRGENVQLVVPRDEGVFYKKVQRGVWCAHPVQVYLDLLTSPERAAEAAARLRADLLGWRA